MSASFSIDFNVPIRMILSCLTVGNTQLVLCYPTLLLLLTIPHDFLNLQLLVEHSGIIYAIKGSLTIGEILRELILIWEVLTPADMAGNLEYL
jgi:hypothetical protein